VGYHFICAALAGEEFSIVVVSKTDVADYINASFTGFDDGRDKRSCTKSRGLNENTVFCVAKCRKPSFILRSVDAIVIRCCAEY
jgi:hypothetical protein